MVRKNVLTALVCVILMSGSLVAQEPLPVVPLDNNAALSYWQAFAMLPTIDDKTRQQMASIMRGESSVDDGMRELVDASDNALVFLHRGARIQPCAWGLAFETGPYAYLPHLGKARELSRLALIRARIRFESGQVEGGMKDAMAAIRLGRHAGREGVVVLVNLLVGHAIESEAIGTIASSLHHMDQEQRNEFQRRVDQLQIGVDMKAALQGERDVFLGWLLREIDSDRPRDRILKLASESTEPETISSVEQASSEQLLDWAESMGVLYDAMIAAVSASDKSIENAGSLEERIAEEVPINPLAKMFLPALGPARSAGKRFLTKRAQLAAAFALFRSGPSALTRDELADPFGDGSFQLNWTEDGATLVSDLRRGDQPVTLRIPGLPK